MLRYLTVATMLLVLAGTGCSNKAEPAKSTGDRPAADGRDVSRWPGRRASRRPPVTQA